MIISDKIKFLVHVHLTSPRQVSHRKKNKHTVTLQVIAKCYLFLFASTSAHHFDPTYYLLSVWYGFCRVKWYGKGLITMHYAWLSFQNV